MSNKILTFIVIVVTFLVLLNACNTSFFQRNSSEKKTQDFISQEQSNQIIQCFEVNDSQKLQSIFSNKIMSTHNIDKEFDNATDFILGTIISYDNPVGTGRMSVHTTDNGVQKEILSGYISNIKTNQDKTYYIKFYSYNVNKDDENMVGVSLIEIFDESTYNKDTNRYPENGIYRIGELFDK